VDSGGQNVYVAQVTRHLVRLGHKVDVFTRRDSTRLPETVDWGEGARIIHVKAGPEKYVRKEDLFPFMGEFTDYCLGVMKGENRYDIVHANFWMSGLVAADIKQRLGIPFVITFHALGRVRRLHQRAADDFPDIRFSIEERIVREADLVIAECPQDQEDLTLLYSADRERTVVVPCGFDPSEFWPIDKFLARRKLGLNKTDFIVLQLGRIVPRKGVDTVIRSFAQFLRSHDVSARLLVVGGEAAVANPLHDREIGRLRNLAIDEGVDDRTVFVGRRSREKLRYYYSAADVFITTPWYEPFGITPLEAMACGVPVIGADVGGIKYTVVEGQTGYLVPPKDEEKTAKLLSYLYSNPSAGERLGKEGIRRVNENFTWQKVTRAVSDVYEEAIAKTRRKPLNRDEQIKTVENGFKHLIDVLKESSRLLHPSIVEASDAIAGCFRRGAKLLVCGNGGSAADAQHFAGELVGRFKRRSRPGLPAIALTADSAIVTAWSNDAGYENVFARQVQAYGQSGDILLCISTSGQSANLLKACAQAHEAGVGCIALLGGKGGELALLSDTVILVPASDPQRIQEVQILTLHLIAELVEEQMAGAQTEALESTNQSEFERKELVK
jgi:phosphoheptose isomerase